jgi:hypothetical protein
VPVSLRVSVCVVYDYDYLIDLAAGGVYHSLCVRVDVRVFVCGRVCVCVCVCVSDIKLHLDREL